VVVAVYLLDTCILLEYLLDQAKADEVEKLLLGASEIPMGVTEFSLYSIGINMLRQKLADRFVEFVDDVLVAGQVRLLRLGPPDMAAIAESARRFGFDFDDAYQYVAAQKHNLTLVSFDADFDRTDRGRKTPADILGEPPIARDKAPTKPARPRSRKR
jgi:predicted nucleic acid-binding protein